MAQKSNIEWTDATWNIARGCIKKDEDCKFCYMYRDSFGGKRYDPRQVIRTKTVFDLPLKYKETKSKCWDGPPLIFTSSLTDWGIEHIDSYRGEMWSIIKQRPDLIFQCLTKRIERGNVILPEDWGHIGYKNVWLGTSIGSDKSMQRYEALLNLPGQRFISFEPLHGKITTSALSNFDTVAMHWIIVGGESGNETGKYRYRPASLENIESIVDHFRNTGVPVFVKQLGTYLSKHLGLKDRHGRDINEFPAHLQFREFPKLIS